MINENKIKEEIYLGMDSTRKVGLQRILSVVCDVFGVDSEDVKSRDRTALIRDARHFYCYIAYNSSQYNSLKVVGSFIGRDHSTVLFSNNKVSGLMDTYQEDLDKVLFIREKLKIVDPTDHQKKDINKNHVGFYNTPDRLKELENWCEEKDCVIKMKMEL